MAEVEDYSSSFGNLWTTVQTGGDVADYLHSISGVQPPLLGLYAAHRALSELHNGGLLQLFFNSTGILLPEAIAGLRALAMPRLSAAFAEAAALLGPEYPRDRKQRWHTLLAAGGRRQSVFARLFPNPKQFYLQVAEATKALPFAALEKRIWELASHENGGFQANAIAIARRLREPGSPPLN